MDYNKVVDSLKGCSESISCRMCAYNQKEGNYHVEECINRLMADAAAAIEALNRLLDQNTQRCEALRKQLRDAHESYEKHLNELEAQLEDRTNVAERWKDMYLTKNEPKRGEWIKHPEVKNIYGGVYIECPFCGEKYVVQDVSDEKFCRNCGSDLRAKMEVQE